MKTILCYGDSNTWGFNPATTERYPIGVRYTSVLQQQLGDGYHVIEEGLCGRTTVLDDMAEGHKNGKRYLLPCLESHRPLDLVIMMLGTNDLKHRFQQSAWDIANNAGHLVQMVQSSWTGRDYKPPKVLLIAPPPLADLSQSSYKEEFEGAIEKSKLFSEKFSQVAEKLQCAFFDSSDVIVSSPIDGIHFEAEEHQKLGKALASAVRELI